MRSRRERAWAAAAQAGSPRVRSPGLRQQRRPESEPGPPPPPGTAGSPGSVPQADLTPQAGPTAQASLTPPADLTPQAGLALPRLALPAWPCPASPGPAGAGDDKRLARRRGLAGRQRGRDRALLRRAVPPDHYAGAEGGRDGQAAANPRGRPGRPRGNPSARSGRSRWWRTAPSCRIRAPASGCQETWRRWPPWHPTRCRPRPSTSRRRPRRTSRRGPRPVTTPTAHHPGLPQPPGPSGPAEPRLRRGSGASRLRAADT